MIISVLGPKGTFSDVASEKYIKENNLKADVNYYNTIDEAIITLVNKESDLAIIPIENTLDGYVQRTLDLLFDEDIFAIDELTIPVNFKLVSKAKSLNEVKTIYVQFKALGQCNNLINSIKGVNTIITESNMASYYKYVEGDDSTAAIIPMHIEDKDANLVVENIADISDNYTRFFVVKRKDYSNFEEDKEDKGFVRVPLYVTPVIDHPGLLFGILRMFAEENINLTSIMSRPTKKKMGTYNFFIEIVVSTLGYQKIIESLNRINIYYSVKVVGRC